MRGETRLVLRMRQRACVQIQHPASHRAGQSWRRGHAWRPTIHSSDGNRDSMSEIGGPNVGARLDRLPPTRYIWCLVGLLSVGAFFEIYDLALTAPLSLGLQVAGVFHRGAAGLFGLSDQATFAAATFAGLYLGTLGFSTVADRF